MTYHIPVDWTALSQITGVSIGIPVLLRNEGRPGDLIEVIISDTEPLVTSRGDVLEQISSAYRVSGQMSEIWLRHIRYDLTSTITPTPTRTCLLSVQYTTLIQNDSALPFDLFTGAEYGRRELKASAENPIVSAAYSDRAYTLTGTYTVGAGEYLSMNVSFKSDVIIKRVATDLDLPIYIYSDSSTGTADGIVEPVNLNMCSIDVSPTTAQLFYGATPAGSAVSFGHTDYTPYALSCDTDTPSVLVKNTTASSKEITIHVVYEETGPRSPSVGLTATTLLEPNTEMSIYG